MSDNWEDWENEDFVVPVFNKEQSKRLEERKLVEESDNALTRTLFSGEEDLVLKHVEVKNSVKSLRKTEKKAPNKNVPNKQKENEEKQKELSKKIKEDKLKKQREREIYGEAEEDYEYAKYEDRFY
jgi:hypothetical protein